MTEPGSGDAGGRFTSGSGGASARGNDEWLSVLPADVGLREVPLDGLCRYVESLAGANVHSVLVARQGALAFERYWPGEDEVWGRPAGMVAHGLHLKHNLRSATKSVVALLVGIARERGLLADLDAPVFDYLPEFADLRTAARDRITLRHLLTMTSGLDWHELGPKTDANLEFA